MTTCSTFFALGMMPFLLYVYSKGIYDGSLQDKVPYKGIMISLVLVLIPCTIGIILKSKRPKYVPYIMKVRMWEPYLRERCEKETPPHKATYGVKQFISAHSSASPSPRSGSLSSSKGGMSWQE